MQWAPDQTLQKISQTYTEISVRFDLSFDLGALERHIRDTGKRGVTVAETGLHNLTATEKTMLQDAIVVQPKPEDIADLKKRWSYINNGGRPAVSLAQLRERLKTVSSRFHINRVLLAFKDWDAAAGEYQYCPSHLARRAHIMATRAPSCLWLEQDPTAPDYEQIMAFNQPSRESNQIQRGTVAAPGETEEQHFVRQVDTRNIRKVKRSGKNAVTSDQAVRLLKQDGLDEDMAAWYFKTYGNEQGKFQGVRKRHFAKAIGYSSFNSWRGSTLGNTAAKRQATMAKPESKRAMLAMLRRIRDGNEVDNSKN